VRGSDRPGWFSANAFQRDYQMVRDLDFARAQLAALR
jgi:hypothetical protein